MPAHPIHEVTNATPTWVTSERVESNTDSQFAAHLPKLNVPGFFGASPGWQSFWDCFKAAILLNSCLTVVQKLNYLWAQLSDKATRVITGLPFTSSNYQHSVSLLKEKYGQPHKLINAHVQALLDLPNPANNLASLQLFHGKVEGHTRYLQSLGKSPKELKTLLVPIILGNCQRKPKGTLPECMRTASRK